MTDRTETVLAEAAEAYFQGLERDGYRPEGCSGAWAAEHILAALKAARIAVVELKRPDDTETDAQEWATSSALCARRFGGAAGDPDRVYVWDKAHAWDHGADPITPTQARELAVALLSAAEEASQ